MAAVAVEGFAELAGRLRDVRAETADGDEALAAVSGAYLSFAERRPAVYDAMFGQEVDLPFATPEAPAALQAAFNELAEAIRPHAADDEVGLLTETFWAALHGLTTLTRRGRLPGAHSDRRLALLLAHFSGRRA